MADESEDVLELEEDAALEEEGSTQGEEGSEDEAGSEGAEEDLIGFGDSEAAPASEEETSTIRQMRDRMREQARRIAELEKQTVPQQAEVQHPGKEPELSDFEYDEEKYRAGVRDYDRKLAAWEAHQAEATERQEREHKEIQSQVQAYQTRKAELRVPDFDIAESSVMTALPQQHQALLMRSGKGAEMVVALHRNPAKLEELAKLNLVDAAMMVGELRSKVTMTSRRKPSVQPDTPLRGNTNLSVPSTDRELARLEKEADRTGDRSKLIAYRKQLREKAN